MARQYGQVSIPMKPASFSGRTDSGQKVNEVLVPIPTPDSRLAYVNCPAKGDDDDDNAPPVHSHTPGSLPWLRNFAPPLRQLLEEAIFI